MAPWQELRTLFAGADCSVKTNPAKGIPLLVATLAASKVSVRCAALMISSPATNFAIRLRYLKQSSWYEEFDVAASPSCNQVPSTTDAMSKLRGTPRMLLKGTKPIIGKSSVQHKTIITLQF